VSLQYLREEVERGDGGFWCLQGEVGTEEVECERTMRLSACVGISRPKPEWENRR
jgi:hypothetical protein